MSSPRARSRNSARAVRNTIGMVFVRSSSSRCSATRQPSSPGIITSRRTTSGCSLRAWSRPLGPSAASSTSMPSASRLTRQSSRIGGSSSMTSTRGARSSIIALYPARFAVTLPNRRRGERQLEGERRALALARGHPDPSAHRRDEAARDEEAEAGPARAAAGLRVGAAVELAEDLILVGLGDADALVGDADLDGLALARRADGDGAARGRVLDRVVEQDREHLAQLVRIRARGEGLRRQLDHEAVPVLLLHALHDLADDVADVGRREVHLEI